MQFATFAVCRFRALSRLVHASLMSVKRSPRLSGLSVESQGEPSTRLVLDRLIRTRHLWPSLSR